MTCSAPLPADSLCIWLAVRVESGRMYYCGKLFPAVGTVSKPCAVPGLEACKILKFDCASTYGVALTGL